MRHLFIINPAAGKNMNVEAVIREIELAMEGREDAWSIVTTAGPGDAEKIARQWCEESEEELRLYALGGDGTLNEVVNGAAGFDHAAVACCPMGSGNDFIKTFGKESRRFRDLKALVEAPAYTMDLIDCNGRQSINICSVGLDARIAAEKDEYKKLPLVTGKSAYILSLLVNVIKGIHRPYEVELDGEKMQGNYTIITACNGQWYGGSFNAAPDAVPDDGWLDFILVDGVSRFTVAGLVGKYGAGRAKEFPDLIHCYRGKSLTVKCDRVSEINVDGERMDTETVTFALSEKKIRFIVPQGAQWHGAQPCS